jgi:hypothetical protein
MKLKDKLKEIKLNVLSVGLEFNDINFLEFTEEEFGLIPSELLDREVIKVREFDTPTYIELVLKEKENK